MGPGVLFGLASAAAFGSGDFAGGLASRRASGMAVSAGAQLVGLAFLLVALAVIRPSAPGSDALIFGAAAGACGGIGLAAPYRGLSLGSMGIVTALSGVGSVVLPLVVGVTLRGNLIGWLQGVGVGAAILAGAAASGATARGVQPQALRMAAVAAVGLGLWFVFLDLAAERDEIWALVASRTAASVLVGSLVLARGGARAVVAVWPLVAAAGMMDVAGNAAFVLSRAEIAVGIAAALSGLYPIVTMLLARLVLREALPGLGVVAVLLAVLGIVLISLG